MAALAGIGDMPETIEDRAVIIAMRRRAPGENVQPFRARRDAPALHALRDRLAGWAGSILDDLADATPDMPIEDRAADNWEPLVAIADAASTTWGRRARSAALVLVAAGEQEDAERSLGMRLLADVRTLVAGLTFVKSADLITGLHRLDESPWRDYDLTTRQLAARLKRYGIHTGHDTTKTMRGYKTADFHDAWSRYLPSEGERPEASERPEPACLLADSTDAHESPDGYKRPTLGVPSDRTTDETLPSDARTSPDTTPPGNPCCRMCGKANLFAPPSIARGICAACIKIIDARELPA